MSNRSSWLIPAPQMDKAGLGYMEPRDPKRQPAWRNHFVACTAEFAGTFLFLLFAFLGHSTAVYKAASTGPNESATSATLMYIALSYGFSLLVNAWTMYRISGGLFNPAVTLGLVLVGALDLVRGALFLPVQLLAAISAAAIVEIIIPGDINQVQTTLAPGMNVAQGLFLEMFLTSFLVFTVLMLAAEKWRATFIAPVGIGIALFVAELAGAAYTGASLNPVRSFGPCVVARDFPSYHWIYWVGPLLGAVLSGGYYHFAKLFNFWEANPGQASGGGSWTPPGSPLLQRVMQLPPSAGSKNSAPKAKGSRRAASKRAGSNSREGGEQPTRFQRASNDESRMYENGAGQSEGAGRRPGAGDAGGHADHFHRARTYDQGYEIDESDRDRERVGADDKGGMRLMTPAGM